MPIDSEAKGGRIKFANIRFNPANILMTDNWLPCSVPTVVVAPMGNGKCYKFQKDLQIPTSFKVELCFTQPSAMATLITLNDCLFLLDLANGKQSGRSGERRKQKLQ